MKVTIKNRFNHYVIFEHESEGNTIKKTLELAVRSSADLSSADLIGANLRGADLIGANLIGANLIGANLRGADLRGASLSSANLIGANLIGANLRGANLIGANLIGANLPIFCKWSHSVIDGKIQIGCKTKSIEEWNSFFNSDATYETKRNTQDFKQIQAVFESYKAYLNFLNT